MVAAQSGQVRMRGTAIVHRAVPCVYFPREAVGVTEVAAMVVIMAQATNAIVVLASVSDKKSTAACQLALAHVKSLLHAMQYRSQYASYLGYRKDL